MLLTCGLTSIQTVFCADMLAPRFHDDLVMSAFFSDRDLYDFLKSRTQATDSIIREWVDLLRAHFNLSVNPHQDLTDAIDSYHNPDHKADHFVDLNNISSIILNYDRLIKWGATKSSYQKLLQYIRQGIRIEPSKIPFEVHTITVSEGIQRPVDKIEPELLESYARRGTEIISTYENTLIFMMEELLVDEDLSPHIRTNVLNSINKGLSLTQAIELIENDKPIVKTINHAQLIKVIQLLWIERIKRRSAVTPLFRALLEKYLYKTDTHFRDQIENELSHYKQSGFYSALSSEFNYTNMVSNQMMKGLREITYHGLSDYAFSPFVNLVQTFLIEEIEKRLIVPALEKLQASGFPVAEDLINQNISSIHESLVKNPQAGGKLGPILKFYETVRSGLRMRETLSRPYITLPQLFEALNTLQENHLPPNEISASARQIRAAFSHILPWLQPELFPEYQQDKEILHSLEKQFTTIKTGRTITLELIPAKGIQAILGYDTGCECTIGENIQRAFLETHHTFLIREKHHLPQQPKGYIDLFDAKGKSYGHFYMLDAIHPSSDLEVSDTDFIRQLKILGQQWLEISPEWLEISPEYKAIHISNEPDLISNRISLSKAMGQLNFEPFQGEAEAVLSLYEIEAGKDTGEFNDALFYNRMQGIKTLIESFQDEGLLDISAWNMESYDQKDLKRKHARIMTLHAIYQKAVSMVAPVFPDQSYLLSLQNIPIGPALNLLQNVLFESGEGLLPGGHSSDLSVSSESNSNEFEGYDGSVWTLNLNQHNLLNLTFRKGLKQVPRLPENQSDVVFLEGIFYLEFLETVENFYQNATTYMESMKARFSDETDSADAPPYHQSEPDRSLIFVNKSIAMSH